MPKQLKTWALNVEQIRSGWLKNEWQKEGSNHSSKAFL